MLCHWLYQTTHIDLFDGRLFRAGTAAMLSIILVLFFMPKYIRFLQRLDATSDFDKDGKTKSPPIMGGLLLVIVVEIVAVHVVQLMAAHTDVVISRNRRENRFAIVFTLTEFAEASSRISVVGWLHEYLRCADAARHRAGAGRDQRPVDL